MTDIRGEVAIVTGASRGLGRHIAARLARAGVRVALAARSEGELARVADELRGEGCEVLPLPVDVGDRESVIGAVETVRRELGLPGILVNNAGLGWYKPFVEWSFDEIDLAVDVNLKGTIYMSRAVLPDMLARRRGQIVNIASDLARRVLPNMAVYVAAKHGVLGFAGSLLREVKSSNVRVMTLTPGIIDTWFNGGVEGSRDETWSLKPEKLAEYIHGMLTLPENWVVDEVAVHPMQQDF